MAVGTKRFGARHQCSVAVVMVLLVSASLAVRAGPPAAPTEDSWWYYEIGGAEPISPPANPNLIPIELWGQIELSAGYSCGKFDPVAAISNSLNEIGQGVEDIGNAMVQAATAAIASLPMLILQRANPGLYDLFQNALLRAEAELELATKTCEQMEAEIAQGKNPYADLITLSKGNDWKVQMGIGGNDAISAKEAVEDANGANGIPWIDGRAGGNGQPSIGHDRRCGSSRLQRIIEPADQRHRARTLHRVEPACGSVGKSRSGH